MPADDDLTVRGLMTSDEVAAYSRVRNLVPGAVLCSADVALTEDAFRSGGKNAPAVDFLRWKDIGIDDREGRIPETDWGVSRLRLGSAYRCSSRRCFHTA